MPSPAVLLCEEPAGDLLIPPVVRTERLLLRQWREDDVEALHQIYLQPEFLKYMLPLDLDGTRAQVQRFMQAWKVDGVCQWAAEDLETGRLIGRIGILRHHDWPEAPDPVEVGWTLHRDWWGRGLATEGGAAGVELWRRYLGDDQRLLSITHPANVRSQAVMERLGMTRRGTARWRDLDCVWYALDR
jgi:RimJ/RimL family protein N-acetyltransferase